MLSPPSISQGKTLSSDNRKQVLIKGRHWKVMEGGGEDRRKIEVTSVLREGDRRRGLCPKNAVALSLTA